MCHAGLPRAVLGFCAEGFLVTMPSPGLEQLSLESEEKFPVKLQDISQEWSCSCFMCL